MVAYSFNKRFVDPIRVGLSKVPLSFDCAPKRQTIRAIGKRRHARPGETLQMYHGMRTKQCFKIGEARCTTASAIYFDFRCGLLQIDDRPRRKHVTAELDEFARSDGFADWIEMKQFWQEEHDAVSFSGVLIKWEPL